MKYLKVVLPAIVLAMSTSVNAVVVNTLGGQQYEWLELTETLGMSRNQVELSLNDSTSSLYGYQYASRSLVDDLFLSYASWDGRNGYYSDAGVITGISTLISDFGPTYTSTGDGINSTYLTVEGDTVNIDYATYLLGFYGTSSECRDSFYTCRGGTNVYFDADGNATMAQLYGNNGFDADILNPNVSTYSYSNNVYGSFLFKPSVVPVPAAAWLFGSALLGFFGFSRRKANA